MRGLSLQMKEDSQDRQLAMATKTPPLKRIRAFSNSFKIISARLKSQMLGELSWSWILQDHAQVTLGARDFSSAVSGFCQVFIVTHARGFGLRPTPKIPTAREKNLCYPGYTQVYKEGKKSNVQVLDGVEIAKKCSKKRVALCTCVDVARCFDYFCYWRPFSLYEMGKNQLWRGYFPWVTARKFWGNSSNAKIQWLTTYLLTYLGKN